MHLGDHLEHGQGDQAYRLGHGNESDGSSNTPKHQWCDHVTRHTQALLEYAKVKEGSYDCSCCGANQTDFDCRDILRQLDTLQCSLHGHVADAGELGKHEHCHHAQIRSCVVLPRGWRRLDRLFSL